MVAPITDRPAAAAPARRPSIVTTEEHDALDHLLKRSSEEDLVSLLRREEEKLDGGGGGGSGDAPPEQSRGPQSSDDGGVPAGPAGTHDDLVLPTPGSVEGSDAFEVVRPAPGDPPGGPAVGLNPAVQAMDAGGTNNGDSPPARTADAPRSDSFDFDGSRHLAQRGGGYLAGDAILSTPPDQFSSGCVLLQLCAIGDLPSVIRHVESPGCPGVNFRDYDRRTAVHVAASEGHLDVVRYLVGRGARVNRSDRWGGSPLDDAHRHRHADVAGYLRSRGGRTGSSDASAGLIAAAAAGDMEEVTMIVGMGGDDQRIGLDLSGSRSTHGNGRIRGVASHGMLRGSFSEPKKGDGGSPSKVQSMVNLPAMLDLSSNRKRAGSVGSESITSEQRPPSPRGEGNAVDVNRGDYDKRTALHLASGEGHLDVVRFLCKRGADVNAEDRWGGRPLDDALIKGHGRVAEVLRSHGAEPGVGGEDGHRRSTRQSTRSSGGLDGSLQDDDEDLRVEFSELEMIERIGSGAFGEIYKCRWRGILVAAKCIKASKIQREWLLKNGPGTKDKDRIANRVEAIKQAQVAITDEEKELALEDFRKETAILRRMRHPNIVMLLAYSQTADVEVMISEICRCSLLDVFKANYISNAQLPKKTQIIYAQQLAQGMNHLHKSRPPVIHRDLKPANLLIDFSGTLKIADFGLAKIRPNPEQTSDEAFLMTGETGSYRFMAPEVFRHEGYTETVDVYSYAMIFYYMILGHPPWPGLSGLDAVTKAALDGERPRVPRNVDARLARLMCICWDEEPGARPPFGTILEILREYSHEVFKTDDTEVQVSRSSRERKCGPGFCVVS